MQCLLPSNGLAGAGHEAGLSAAPAAEAEPAEAAAEPRETLAARLRRQSRERWQSFCAQSQEQWQNCQGRVSEVTGRLWERAQRSPLLQRCPSKLKVMGFLYRRSSVALILAVFILVQFYPVNFMMTLQQLLCLLLLALPKEISRRYATRFFIAAACLSILAQLLGFTRWHRMSEEQMYYFGVAPKLGFVCRDLIIIILAMLEGMLEAPLQPPDSPSLAPELPMEQEMVLLQGASARGSQLPDVWRRALRPQLDPVTEVRQLLLAVPQLAALGIVVICTLEETVWCLPSLAVVGGFYASGGMVKPPMSSNPWQLPERARFWIQVMVISLAVGMLGEMCSALWLPPMAGFSAKPVPDSIALWEMCRNYDPWNPSTPRNITGHAQAQHFEQADWLTQRQRCGRDMDYWMCLECGLRVPKFILFFALCWVLHTSWDRPRSSPDESSEGPGRSKWLQRLCDLIFKYILEPLGCRSESEEEKHSDLKLFMIWVATILCWISIIVAFLWQRTFNIVALGYLWMALMTGSSASNATLYRNPARAILWPARAVGIFNFIVIVACCVCQCPSFPCPYSLELTGPAPGEMQLTRFLSGEQCLHYSKTVGSASSDTWMMGALFQSFGMMKTGGLSEGAFQDVVHCLVFATCLMQRILVERWHQDLRDHFERHKALLDFRAQWYAEKLATSRQVQLSMWDTKRQVLLNKLSRVTQQLNTLRSIWDGQRPAFTEKEEEENHHKARVEHICLKGGVNELLVTGLLKEFTRNCGEQLVQELQTQKRLQAQGIIDKAVVEYLHRRYLRKLKMITSTDEAASKQRLMQESQEEVETLKDSELDGDAPGETEPTVSAASSSALRQRKASEKAMGVTSSFHSEADSYTKDDSKSPAAGGISRFWADLFGAFLDDMLFIRENDETLYEHRKGNSAKLLFLKALLSQSVPALVLCSALQFMAFRSICAGLSVVIVVCALMAFPHVPWTVWVFLQWLNISVIFAKVVFQLPLFCEDGSLDMGSCPSLCREEMPWTALLGLVKTQQNANAPCSLAEPSLSAVLWADVLFSLVLLLVMCASRMGGRFGSTSQILESLKAVEKKNRRMSTHITREILKAASLAEQIEVGADDDDDEEDEELGGNPSGAATPAPGGEEAQGSRWAKMLKHVQAESKKLKETGWQWWKDTVVAPAYVRKPARDLYEIRLSLALTCLAMLIFGWTSMVDSGRSFSTSLKTNNFSGTQVRVLVLFLIMIVVDRALYTWYRGDHGRDGTGNALNSASFKGLLARVVMKILVVVHVILLHCLFIEQWSRKVVRKEKMKSDRSLISMSMLSGFYVLYLTYLALSSLQLKYDVHVMRGGLRFCHSTDIGSMLVFKAYSAIPFLNELRVITDWTVTETSMNLFMWLKLEDAHHSLYRTRLDMEGRALTEPASARPMFEKVYMGVALLLLLLGLLVGPIIFFSALNTFMLVPSVVKSATMSVDVKVEATYGHRALNLYTAVQDYIENHNESSAQDFQKRLLDSEIPISLQDIRFPFASDELWEMSASRQQMIAELINPFLHPDVTVKLRLSYQFHRNSSLPVDGFKEVVVDNSSRADLGRMLTNCLAPVNVSTCPPYFDFTVKDLFPKYLRTGHGQIAAIDFAVDQEETLNYGVTVAFHRGDRKGLPHWRVMTNATGVGGMPISRTDAMRAPEKDSGNQLTFTMASNHVSATQAHAPSRDSRNEKQMSINGLYLGVVLTIGNLFRSIFKDSSKRMIYEEVSDTDLLLDLCDGIYLARVQGNLHAEWMLYHIRRRPLGGPWGFPELIRIYRSPELLAHLSGKKGAAAALAAPPSAAPSRDSATTSSRVRWGIVAEHVRHANSEARE